MAGRVGFEPTVPLSITGFQDRLLKPLGHLPNLKMVTLQISLQFVKCCLPNNPQLDSVSSLSDDFPTHNYDYYHNSRVIKITA